MPEPVCLTAVVVVTVSVQLDFPNRLGHKTRKV